MLDSCRHFSPVVTGRSPEVVMMRDEIEVQREAARSESRRAYVEALRGLSDAELR
jgi:hypothetical protein